MTMPAGENQKPDPPPDTISQDDTLRAAMQLVRTYAKFEQQAHQVFRRHGMTGAQFDVLATLHRGEGIMQQELAARLLVTKGNVTGVVGRMEALGWVERRADPKDRRACRLYLTGDGEAVFAAVARVRRATIQEIMSDLPPEEVRALASLLRKLEHGIDGSKGTGE